MDNLELKNTTELLTENVMERKKFANQSNLDKQILLQKNVTLSKFKSIGFLETKLKSCIFDRNTFEDCYFRRAELKSTSFVGSKFISCNFLKTKFINCDLDYVCFRECAVDFENIVDSLPSRVNLRKELCKNLAMEHLKAGNTKEYKKFFFEERECSRNYHKDKFISKDNYTREQFNVKDALSGFKHFCLITLDKELWGYGEKIKTVFRNILILNIGFYIYFNFIFETIEKKRSIVSLKTLALNFMNISTPADYLQYWSFISHRILGILFCGLFIATLFRMVNKR